MYSPSVGESNIPIIFKKVLLPQPDEPNIVAISPLFMEKFNPFKTNLLPSYVFFKFDTFSKLINPPYLAPLYLDL